MELNEIFTDEQINSIRRIIMRQCQRHQAREQNYQDLCYAPYAGNRVEHSITTSVLSGFRENTQIQGINIYCINYGLHAKMGQPVLESDNFIAHIYNSGCGFTAKPFKDNCLRYNTNTEELPVFVCIVFTASDNGVLENISINIPNANGIWIREFEIYNFAINNEEIA